MEYRTQMKPVAAKAIKLSQKHRSIRIYEKFGLQYNLPTFWDILSFSAGRLKSFRPAATSNHFANGAQKNTVFGPAYSQIYWVHQFKYTIFLSTYQPGGSWTPKILKHLPLLLIQTWWSKGKWNESEDMPAVSPNDAVYLKALSQKFVTVTPPQHSHSQRVQ